MEAISVTLAQVALSLNAALRGVPEPSLWKMPLDAEFYPGRIAPLPWLASHPSTGFAISVAAPDFRQRSGQWTLLRLQDVAVEAWSMSYDFLGSQSRGGFRSPSTPGGHWRARFRRDDVSVVAPHQTLGDARIRLEATLDEMVTHVATSHPQWVASFQRVQSLLAGEADVGQALIGGEQLLSWEARATVGAVLQAQFFTGMGNWTDNSLGAEGEALTGRLYGALSDALVAAVNTSAKSPDH